MKCIRFKTSKIQINLMRLFLRLQPCIYVELEALGNAKDYKWLVMITEKENLVFKQEKGV